jgi:hypothetical protein
MPYAEAPVPVDRIPGVDSPRSAARSSCPEGIVRLRRIEPAGRFPCQCRRRPVGKPTGKPWIDEPTRPAVRQTAARPEADDEE